VNKIISLTFFLLHLSQFSAKIIPVSVNRSFATNQAVPAISKCAHGVLPTAFAKNAAAVIVPATLPGPVFLMSA
jgi:hypothetical protein